MKWLSRAALLAGLVLLGLASSQIASAADITEPVAPTHALAPALAPAPAPNAQGCSGTPNIQYAYANPAAIAPGQVTTLFWGLVGNANAAFLQYPNGNRVGIGTPGSQQVNPTQTTTYFIIGVCGNNQVQFPITVTVNGGPTCNGTPQISSFTANPTTINSGQSTTLSWGIVTNATNVQLSSSTQGGSGVPTPGSVQSSPTQTTTYFLTAWCNGNSVQSQVVVTVNNPPPPPPANNTAITSINVNGGLTSGNTTVYSVGYFWNGADAPAVLQGTAFNSGGGVIGNSNATRINPNANLTANLNFPLAQSSISRVSFCIIGSSSTDLACQSQ